MRSNLISWKSSSDKLKHASSTAGEVNAIREATEDIDDVVIITEALFGPLPIRMLTDSNSGMKQIANGGHTIRSRRTAEYIRSMHKDCILGAVSLEHVSGQIQLADGLTKIKKLTEFNE